jgi:hypothetical protein
MTEKKKQGLASWLVNYFQQIKKKQRPLLPLTKLKSGLQTMKWLSMLK